MLFRSAFKTKIQRHESKTACRMACGETFPLFHPLRPALLQRIEQPAVFENTAVSRNLFRAVLIRKLFRPRDNGRHENQADRHHQKRAAIRFQPLLKKRAGKAKKTRHPRNGGEHFKSAIEKNRKLSMDFRGNKPSAVIKTILYPNPFGKTPQKPQERRMK